MRPSRNARDLRDDFDARTSPAGLFASYLRGRLRHFWMRQAVLLAGAAFVGWLSAPATGLWIALIGTLGEAIDCAALRGLRARDPSLPSAVRVTTITAGLHAVAIAACVVTAWHAGASGDSRFFAIACLAGAVINAGLLYPFHPQATRARISIYLLTLGGLFAEDGLMRFGSEAALKYDAVGVLILAFSIHAFVVYLLRLRTKRLEGECALIDQQAEVDAANTRLRAREQDARRMALVAENANDSVIVTGCDGRIEYVNKSFERVTGYTRAEAIGQLPATLLNAPGTSADAVARIADARRTHTPVRVELLNRTRDGREIWIETAITPMLDEHGALMGEVAIEREIGLQKQRERELADAKIAAEEGARVKEQFLAMVSHEMRTPLNGIIGLTETLLSGALTEDQRHTALTVMSSGEALLAIINDILDLSKLEAGQMEVTHSPMSIDHVVSQVEALIAPLAREKGLGLHTDLARAPRAQVLGDSGRLRQILLNLLSNAVKFTSSGHVRMDIYGIDGAEPRVAFRVTDTGVGIPRERLALIFDAFAQADATIARDFGGTGLGLTISRQLARIMGGDITVSSTEGEGAVFTLTLPALPAAPGVAPPQPSGPPARTVHALGGLHVLVAEDNKTNRLLLEKLLAPLCASLSFATDGLEAVEHYARTPPDIVFMDMQMPRCDGLESTRRIRQYEIRRNRPRVPIIALTANAFASDRDACRRAGMDAFVSKPIRRDALLEVVARVLQPVGRENPLDVPRVALP